MLESPAKKNLVIRAGAVSSALVCICLSTYAVFVNGPVITVAIPSVAALFGLYIFALTFSKVEVSEKHIKVSTPQGQYQMRWDEITRVEKSISDHQFKLIGNNKHLVVNLTWAPKSSEKVISMITEHAKKIGIEIDETFQVKEVNFNTKIIQ